MYSTNTATTNNEEFISSYMPVGINENVILKEVNINSANGKPFLEIVFENNQGQTATMTEWKNEKNLWVKTDEDLQKRDNQQFGRILQVIDAVKGSHDEFEGNSFTEMINWAKNQLTVNSGDLQQGLRLKICYNKKGYTRVSNLGIFVEPMSVQESQIKLFKNDLMERPVVADVETATDPLAGNSAPVTADSNTGADDLPF